MMSDREISSILDFGTTSSSVASKLRGASIPSGSHMPKTLTCQDADDRTDFRIKRLKTKDLSNDTFVKYIKQKLDVSTDSILQGDGKLLFSYESLYKNVEFICKQADQSSKLTNETKSKIKRHFIECFIPRIMSVLENEELTANVVVESFISIFNEWEWRLVNLCKIYLYLDRSYLLQSESRLELKEYGLDVFVSNLLEKNKESIDEKDEKRSRKLILSRFSKLSRTYREIEDAGSYSLMVEFMNVITKLDFKKNVKFQTFLKDDAMKTYADLRSEWILYPEKYVSIALKKLQQENEFFSQWKAPVSFIKDVVSRLEFILVYDDLNDILNRCLSSLISSFKDGVLRKLFLICHHDGTPNPNINTLAYQWGNYIQHNVALIISKSKANADFDMIGSLINLYDTTNEVCELSFNSNEKFDFELRESFIRSLSNDTKVVIEKLCKYSDNFFKNVSKTKNGIALIDSPTEKVLSNIITLLKLIRDKETFIQNYQRDLSRRLLFNRSNDLSSEISLVNEFTTIIGGDDYCLNLVQMFKDLDLSKNYTSGFASQTSTDLELNVMMLNKKSWPEVPMNNVKLPPLLAEIASNFGNFYNTGDDENKKFDWCFTLHNLTIDADFPLGNKELNMNIFQAAVMLLFNDMEEISYSQIKKATGMDAKLLKSTINSLVNGRYKLLISDTPEFTNIKMNEMFSDKLTRLKIPAIQYKDKSTSKGIEPLARDRTDEYRAAFAKVLKAEKRLIYEDLMAKVIACVRVRGDPTVQDLKEALEYLITQEYIKREIDGVHFSYIA